MQAAAAADGTSLGLYDWSHTNAASTLNLRSLNGKIDLHRALGPVDSPSQVWALVSGEWLFCFLHGTPWKGTLGDQMLPTLMPSKSNSSRSSSAAASRQSRDGNEAGDD